MGLARFPRDTDDWNRTWRCQELLSKYSRVCYYEFRKDFGFTVQIALPRLNAESDALPDLQYSRITRDRKADIL